MNRECGLKAYISINLVKSYEDKKKTFIYIDKLSYITVKKKKKLSAPGFGKYSNLNDRKYQSASLKINKSRDSSKCGNVAEEKPVCTKLNQILYT